MFASFFLAGFEGSTGFNRNGQWFDQVVATGHQARADADYADIAAAGLRAAREIGPLAARRPGPRPL